MTKNWTPFSQALARRRFIQWSAGALAIPVVSPKTWAQGGQAYPTRPINLVVFTPAGNLPDIMGRLIADVLSQRMGQPVIVENRPGAGGNLALQAVARAPADGHTLLLASSVHTVGVSLYPSVPANVTRDIAPVATLNRDAFILLVGLSSPAKSVAEFVAHATANPGKINLASNGTGTIPHLAGELFRMTAGIDTQHIPYRGSPAALAALMAGDVHALFDSAGASLPLVRSGKLRALGVTSAERLRSLPDVPAIAESLPGYEVIGWLGIGAPRGIPAEVVQRLNGEINAALGDPAIKARMNDLESNQFVSSPGEFGKFLAEDAEKWRKVVEASGLKVE
ncbi:MAG: tripartite tricarboxylate transporter substrate binding protein [Xanthobacteraceae bacterium]|nr:tripartite tricarboxylate transporter substrate binding protein [Xanthobacteraceae bacterium]